MKNINEFSLHYINVIPVIILVSFVLGLGINAVALFISEQKIISCYIALIFSITIGVYIQSNFLNPKLSSLDGAEINWSPYSKQGWISGGFWIVCVLISVLSVLRWREKAERVIKYIAYFLSAVQILSLAILILTNKLDESAYYGFSKDREFSIGSKENIVLFVGDTLQAAAMEEYLASDIYSERKLQNFTFFDNAVSGGAPTQLAMPLLLTGIEYDPMQDLDEYRKEV